ncbi:MAG: hypothetical protein QY309_10510 [Cyclobacteriaceae bacterium]|nr:MAG: hypothetical protein QY309_10510 [Cyclobacteriaceae bacterium]
MTLPRDLVEQTFQEELYAIRGNTIVLVPQDWSTYKPDEQELLIKILNSVKLRFEGIQLLVKTEADLETLRIFNPVSILSFGVTLKQATTSYTSITWEGIRVVLADNLSALDDQKKKQLWGVLKTTFLGS